MHSGLHTCIGAVLVWAQERLPVCVCVFLGISSGNYALLCRVNVVERLVIAQKPG